MKKIIVITSLIVIILGGIISCKKIRHELVPTRIEGTVVDILNGEAIPNAEITLWEGKRDFNQPVATAQSDAQGKFKIKYKFKNNDDSDGKWRYSVSAKKEGYYRKNNSNKAEFDVNNEAIVQVEPTRANKNIILKLIPITTATIELEDVPPYENANSIFFSMSAINNFSSFSGGNAKFINVIANQYNLNIVNFDTVLINNYSVKIKFYNSNGNLLEEKEYGNINVERSYNNIFKIQY